MRKSSLNGNKIYEHTVLPTVSEVSPKTGLPDGQDLLIKGTGFSTNK